MLYNQFHHHFEAFIGRERVHSPSPNESYIKKTPMPLRALISELCDT